MRWLILSCIFLSACSQKPEPIPVATFLSCNASLTAVFVSTDEVHFGLSGVKEKYIEEVARKMAGGFAPSADRISSVIKLDTCSLDWFKKEAYPGTDFAVKIVDNGKVEVFTTSRAGIQAIMDHPFQGGDPIKPTHSGN